MDEQIKQMKILIVEDEVSLLAAIRDVLTEDGYMVFDARDGEEGLTIALSQKPDLILLDVLMPKMGGMDMLKKLRESSEYGKQVRVILLTNLEADDKMVSDVVETQPSYYLVKSDMNIDGISEKVKDVLEG